MFLRPFRRVRARSTTYDFGALQATTRLRYDVGMEASCRPVKVLVIDDNAENRALAAASLEDEDYAVVAAASGHEGLRAFESERPDGVLLDIRMPDMDGFSVCSRIRQLPGGAEIPILFFTALRNIDTFERSLSAGGDDFLTKPVCPTELVLRMQTALRIRRMSSELREHYSLVRQQRDALIRLQLQKERLTAFVVHDLKQPLNSMDLYAQVLLRDPDLSERSRSAVQKIRDGARSLLRLILNLLDISRSEEGQLSVHDGDVDLEELVDSVVEAHGLQARSLGVVLVADIKACTLRGDADLLRRVLENLLDNAIRRAPEDSEVRVAAHHDGLATEIHVVDAGPGIAPDMRQKIFEPFVQLETSDRIAARTSRGLGLTFCRLAIEAHGGSMRVEDANPGTVFCIRLPDDRHQCPR